MQKITKIKSRLKNILIAEAQRTSNEMDELRQKQHDNMSYYGSGGPYYRYEKAIERRKEHLNELETTKRALDNVVVLENLRLFGYFCPSCGEKVYLQTRNPETVYCPLCERKIYQDGRYTEWKIQKGSQYTNVHH